jgi:hypothetical protein
MNPLKKHEQRGHRNGGIGAHPRREPCAETFDAHPERRQSAVFQSPGQANTRDKRDRTGRHQHQGHQSPAPATSEQGQPHEDGDNVVEVNEPDADEMSLREQLIRDAQENWLRDQQQTRRVPKREPERVPNP